MKKALLSIALFTGSMGAISQKSSKKFAISSGLDLAGNVLNTKKIESAVWIQFEYRLNSELHLAIDCEFLKYTQYGFYRHLPENKNDLKSYGNNLSLLLKYPLPLSGNWSLKIVSGLTYGIIRAKYYHVIEGPPQILVPTTASFNGCRIPTLLEPTFKISEKIEASARLRYNLSMQNGSTFSTGLSLSLIL